MAGQKNRDEFSIKISPVFLEVATQVLVDAPIATDNATRKTFVRVDAFSPYIIW